MYPYIIQGNNIVLVIDGESHTVTESHLNYQKLLEAIRSGDWDIVPNLVSPENTLVNFGQGNITIEDNVLKWNGRELHNALSRQIIRMVREGFDVEPLVKFMENLMRNPSSRAVEELYGFLEKGELPITPDGCFLAYKKVSSNFRDVHSNSVVNKPAHLMSQSERDELPVQAGLVKTSVKSTAAGDRTEVSMPRNSVDDVATNTCSHGLHFCSLGYLKSFGGEHTLILKINPADVVSIPTDYNLTKGRTWRYQIEGVLGGDPETAFTSSVQDWDDLSDEWNDDVDPDWDW